MLGLPGAAESNFRPPTAVMLAHGAGYAGVLLLVQGPVRRRLAGARTWAAIAVAGAVGFTAYCWHLTAALGVQGVLLLLGASWPSPPDVAGWLLLPAFFVVCAVPLVGLVLLFRRWEATGRGEPATGRGGEPATPRGERATARGGAAAAVAGVVLSAAGLLVLSQAGLDSLVDGDPEDVFGVPLVGWEGVVALAVGLALLRPGGRRVAQPAGDGGRGSTR